VTARILNDRNLDLLRRHHPRFISTQAVVEAMVLKGQAHVMLRLLREDRESHVRRWADDHRDDRLGAAAFNMWAMSCRPS